MEELKIFENPAFGKIRALTIDNEPWFVGKDVASVLGYAAERNAIAAHVDDEDKLTHQISAAGQMRNVTLINESGLYSLILSSKLDSAKAFKRWVTSEVLPAIRKHGAYMTPETLEAALLNPDTLIRLATELKAERDKRQALEAKVAADAPKVRYAESVEGADNGTLVREFAKFLRENGVDTGEKRLYEDLRRRGFLIRAEGRDRNSPTQRAMDMGLFTVKETIVQTPQGGKTRTTPLLTGKGKVYFMSMYLRERDAAANPAPVAEAAT